jgi:hypothetical protein
MRHMQVGDDPAMLKLHPSGWLFHLRNLAQGTGFIMLAAGLVGLAGAVAVRRRKPWPLLIFGVAAFAMIAGTQVRFARYAMPLLPVIAVLAAGVVSDDLFAMTHGRWRAWATAGAVSILMVGSVLAAALMDYRMLDALVEADARAQALEVLEERVPRDGSIGLITEPWFYHPPVDYCNGGSALRNNPLWAAYREPIRELAILGLDPAELRAERPEAVVVTAFEISARAASGDPAAASFLNALDAAGYRRVAQPGATPWGSGEWRPVAHDLTYPFPSIAVYLQGEE